MFNKKAALAVIALLILFSITGCDSGGAASVETGIPQASDGSYAGGQQADNVNLKSISVESQGDDTIVSLSFVSGSRNSGEGDESSIDYVPEYKAYMQKDHARFVVEIPNLRWWDFERDSAYTAADLTNTKIKGVFGLATYNERPYQLYLQLDEDSNVIVTESSNTITIKFSPKDTTSQEKYYVLANAYYDYKDGNIAQSYGLTPTLCDDSQHKVLISEPFDSESKANELKAKILDELGVIISDEDIKVSKLATDKLPTFDFTKDEMAVYDVAVYAKIGDSQKQKAEITIPGGYYLSTSSDCTQIAYKKRVEIQDNSSDQIEELWVINNSDNSKQKIGDEYNGIYSAKFSSDGKKIAFLDIDIYSNYSASELYVYDFGTKELRNLSEEGLGSVSTYAWGDNSNTLYTVSQLGVENVAQLLKCDLTKSSGDMVTSVRDQAVTPNYDGGLTYANSKLYLRDYDAQSDDFIIYEIDPSGAQWNKLANGVIFNISPDGKYMFVESYIKNDEEQKAENPDKSDDTSKDDFEDANYSDDEVPNTDVIVIDLATKEQKKVISAQKVYKAGWASNDKIYYVLKQNTDDAAFSYVLKTMNKDGSSISDVCQIATYNVLPTGTEGSYYLTDTKDISDDVIKYVTYTIKKADLED